MRTLEVQPFGNLDFKNIYAPTMHLKVEAVYFVATGKAGGWTGTATFMARGKAEIWNPVTGTWYNKLVHDARLPPESRTTWTIAKPGAGARYVSSGLIGPVVLETSP